jgi:hypothetical protein
LKEYYIYSIRVCLLEIGLWRSFILYSQDQKTPTPSQDFVSVFDCAESPDPEAIKEHLVSLAKTALPRHMGGK